MEGLGGETRSDWGGVSTLAVSHVVASEQKSALALLGLPHSEGQVARHLINESHGTTGWLLAYFGPVMTRGRAREKGTRRKRVVRGEIAVCLLRISYVSVSLQSSSKACSEY